MLSKPMQTLLATDFPEGEVDGLGANGRHRLLAQRLQDAASGTFWGAPRPACDYTFSQGPIGWLATAVPLVVHDRPALAALGEAFTDGANVWVHGPWLQAKAAELAHDPNTLVEWFHFALEDVARLSQGLPNPEPVVPTVAPEAVAQALKPLVADEQPVWNRWHAPGDPGAVLQALAWAERLDPAFASSGLPNASQGTPRLPAMPAPTPWKAWATVVAEHLPEADGSPLLRQGEGNVFSAQHLLRIHWQNKAEHRPLVDPLYHALRKDGLEDAQLLGRLAHALQSTALGSHVMGPADFSVHDQVTSLPIQSEDIVALRLDGFQRSDCYTHVVVHPVSKRPTPALSPIAPWAQACVLAALAEGAGLDDPRAVGTLTQAPWALSLPSWKVRKLSGNPHRGAMALAPVLDVLASSASPLTWHLPQSQTPDLAALPVESLLQHRLSLAEFFTSLIHAPVFAARTRIGSNDLMQGYLETKTRTGAEEQGALLQALKHYQQHHQLVTDEHLERFCNALVSHHLRSWYLMGPKKDLNKLMLEFEGLKEALGLAEKHLLGALLKDFSGFEEAQVVPTLANLAEACITQGVDLHQPHGMLEDSVWGYVETHAPQAPALRGVRNVMRQTTLTTSLPPPLPAPTPRIRF